MSKLTTNKSAPVVVSARAKTLSPKDRLAVQRAAEIAAEEARVASRLEAKRAAAARWYAKKKASKAQPAPVVAAPAKAPAVAQQPAHKAAPQQPAQQSLDLGVTLSQAQGALAVQLAGFRKRAAEEPSERNAGIAEGLRIAARILDLVR